LHPIVRLPTTALTSANTSLVTASTESSTAHVKWQAYDNVYGQNALSVHVDAGFGGWNSTQTSALQVDSVSVTGSFNYIDLGSTAIVRSFQIYCVVDWFPISYHIIGSDNQLDWTSLYFTPTSVVEGTYVHGSYPGRYSPEIDLSNWTQFNYVGILIISSNNATVKAVQELLLWGYA
jgi:hypothetical protein